MGKTIREGLINLAIYIGEGLIGPRRFMPPCPGPGILLFGNPGPGPAPAYYTGLGRGWQIAKISFGKGDPFGGAQYAK